MGRLILITGGARSGKSDYALQRALQLDGEHYFFATCPVVDSEMDERILRHKAERAETDWQTVEEEILLAKRLQELPPRSICLLDCLTLWVNNLMYAAHKADARFRDDEMQEKCEELLVAAKQYEGTLFCVSNEVGMGIVPDNPAARLYRDLVGRCNRIIAAAADEVILVSCGLPLHLKE